MAASAGKRETRPPDFLLNAVSQQSQSEKIRSNMSPPTTKTITVPTSMSMTTSNILTPNPVSGFAVSNQLAHQTPSKIDDESMTVLKNMLMSLRSDIKAESQKNESREVKSEQRHAENKIHYEQCIERWQGIDTRVSKVEEENADHEVQLAEQKTFNVQTNTRLDIVENDIISLRRDLARFANAGVCPVNIPTSTFATSILTSTTRPGMPVNINPPTYTSASGVTMPPTNNVNNSVFSCDPTRSYYSAQERLQDAVCEFSGQIQNLHPERFLDQLTSYFENVFMSPTQQLVAAQRRLIGDARMWYESLMPTPLTYLEFCVLFRQRFWSETAQRKARNDVLRPYTYDRYTGLTTHAMKWIASAKYLSPPFDQRDLVSLIIQHFPTPLNIALRGRSPQSTNELLAILTEFEESSPPVTENRRHDNRRNDNREYDNQRQDHRGYDHRRQDNRGYDNRRNNNVHEGDRYRSAGPQHQQRGNNGHQPYQSRPPTQQTPPVQPVNQIDVSGNEQEPRT